MMRSIAALPDLIAIVSLKLEAKAYKGNFTVFKLSQGFEEVVDTLFTSKIFDGS